MKTIASIPHDVPRGLITAPSPLVFICLYHAADNSGELKTNYTEVSAMTGLSLKITKRCLEQLREHNYIEYPKDLRGKNTWILILKKGVAKSKHVFSGGFKTSTETPLSKVPFKTPISDGTFNNASAQKEKENSALLRARDSSFKIDPDLFSSPTGEGREEKNNINTKERGGASLSRATPPAQNEEKMTPQPPKEQTAPHPKLYEPPPDSERMDNDKGLALFREAREALEQNKPTTLPGSTRVFTHQERPPSDDVFLAIEGIVSKEPDWDLIEEGCREQRRKDMLWDAMGAIAEQDRQEAGYTKDPDEPEDSFDSDVYCHDPTEGFALWGSGGDPSDEKYEGRLERLDFRRFTKGSDQWKQ